jgi:hypothetical protein
MTEWMMPHKCIILFITTRLQTNTQKSLGTPIRCAEVELNIVTQHLMCLVKHFPVTYHGIDLSIWSCAAHTISLLYRRSMSRLQGEKQESTWCGSTLFLSNLSPLRLACTDCLRSIRWSGSDLRVVIDKKWRGIIWKDSCYATWRNVCHAMELVVWGWSTCR